MGLIKPLLQWAAGGLGIFQVGYYLAECGDAGMESQYISTLSVLLLRQVHATPTRSMPPGQASRMRESK